MTAGHQLLGGREVAGKAAGSRKSSRWRVCLHLIAALFTAGFMQVSGLDAGNLAIRAGSMDDKKRRKKK